MLRFPLYTLTFGLALMLGQVADAQSPERIVIIDALHDPTPLEQALADSVEGALRIRGTRVLSAQEVRERVQARSRAPVESSDADLDRIARDAEAAIEGNASAATDKNIRAVIGRAEQALESFNRDTNNARHVLDACLSLVRDALAHREHRDALAEAMRCRRLVPDVAPSEMYHSTSVIRVCAEADQALRKLNIGRLRVQSMPQSGCAVYVNGRRLGITPFALERAPAGAYRVQVECDRGAGRVHMVQLGDDPAELVVDVDLDRALRSEPRVALVYEGDVHEGMLANHASQLGRWMHSEEVVSLHVDAEKATLRRVRSDDAQRLARVDFMWHDGMDAQSPELAAAIDRLLAEQLAEQPPSLGADTVVPVMHDRAGRGVATALASLGAGALATGVAFEIVRSSAENKLADADLGADEAHQRDRYQRAQALRWLGVVGGTLLSAAAPLFYLSGPQPARVPTWTYAALVAGIGLAAWGSYELARAEHCRLYAPDQGCETWRDTDGRGALALAAAAPLLSFSLTYWIGARVERARQAHLYLAPSSTSLAVIMRKELW